MPWKRTCALKERFKFVRDGWSEEWSLAELCRRYEVSRKTGCKGLERYQAAGLEGLRERSAPLVNTRSREPGGRTH